MHLIPQFLSLHVHSFSHSDVMCDFLGAHRGHASWSDCLVVGMSGTLLLGGKCASYLRDLL